MTRADILHVPYKGCGPAAVDLAAGQVQVAITSVRGNDSAIVKAGKVRNLSQHHDATARRLAPDLPSAEESGVARLPRDQWFGLFAPGKTPRDIIDRMNARDRQGGAREEFVKKLLAQRHRSVAQHARRSSQVLARADFERWGRLAREINLKLD